MAGWAMHGPVHHACFAPSSPYTVTMNVSACPRPIRLGVVRFLNTQPIIAGLDQCADVSLTEAVPSELIGLLERDVVDVALCSSIDYQRAVDPLVILPAPPLGCCGATRTVRLYSTRPFEDIKTVHCDIDSHTSVVLLQVLWQELHGCVVEVVPFDAGESQGQTQWPEAVLLIGDKVVSGAPSSDQYSYQVDLGEAWHELTGLPFLFAVWMARAEVDPMLARTATALLDRQFRYNQVHSEGLIARECRNRSWPMEMGRDYLARGMRYEFGPVQRQGLERFHALAAQHGLIDTFRSLEILSTSMGV
jgi:chorismate dehydratase